MFLGLVSLGWSFYYNTNTIFNDYGAANYEWLYLLDALVTLPIICLLCIKNKKDAIIKSLALACLAIFIGSVIIPEQNKWIWTYLENGRYLLLACFLVFEIAAIWTVSIAIKSAILNAQDPDSAIEQPIKRITGQSLLTNVFCFEARLWSFVLFANKIKPENYTGQQHFTYHVKDGAQSNLLGFMILIAIELPIVHVLLHFIWSPMAANIISGLTALSVVFFYGEHKAISRRPISLAGDNLIIRYGLSQPITIPLQNIQKVYRNKEVIRRSSECKRYNFAGTPNIVIELSDPMGRIKTIYLGVDEPEMFISTVLTERTSRASYY